MDRRAAEAAFDMKGAFNDLIVSLGPGTSVQSVLAELDRLLEPYGSVGAIERRDQPSNRFLEDELNQQKVMSITIPFIFFGVAAFLLNVTLGRLVAAQREQIAALKALGFAPTPIATHYLKLVAVIVLLASLVGIPAGIFFGEAMIASYHGFFRFPALAFQLTPWSAAAGVGASFAMAAFGVLSALRNVMILAPAVAMRPAAPVRFRRSWFEPLMTASIFKPSHIMVLRNIAGRPVRSVLTIMGIALAVPMVTLGLFWRDAIDHMIEVQFNLVERGNVVVTFPHPFHRRIVSDLSR
jgi:putative ABC transport system permease protein